MKPTRLLALATVALFAACTGLISDPVSSGVAYQADRAAYTAQDEIVASLTNHSDAPVGYNLCGSPLEVRSGGTWRHVDRNPEHPCTQPLYTLQPGEGATFREPASHLPGPGTYRLRTRVEAPLYGGWRDVVTPPFTLR